MTACTSDRPGAPGDLKVADIGTTDATLVWSSPATDGGAPITRYVVEKQEVEGEWQMATMTKKQEIKLGGLAEGKTYNFRWAGSPETNNK